MDIEVNGICSLPCHQQSEVSTCVHCTAAEKQFWLLRVGQVPYHVWT